MLFMQSSPILATAHHDPKGKYNQVFEQQLPELKKTFSKICLSVSPATSESNGEFINEIKDQGCIVLINDPGTNPGDHFRNALDLAVHNAGADDRIFYGDMDRILFQLASEHQDGFISDLNRDAEEFLVYERTEEVWSAYPKAYREMESHITAIGELIYGKRIEYNFCSAMMLPEMATYFASNSYEDHYNARGEWILLYFKLRGHFPTSRKVSWLAWEDPFWEAKTSDDLRSERERDLNETKARIDSNSRFIRLFLDERFK